MLFVKAFLHGMIPGAVVRGSGFTCGLATASFRHPILIIAVIGC